MEKANELLLIKRVLNNDVEAIDLMIDEYGDYFKKLVLVRYPFLLNIYTLDELVQEGLIVLFDVLDTYNPDKNASLRTFASLCVSRRWVTTYRREAKKKFTKEGFVYLDAHTSLYDTETLEYHEVVSMQKFKDPEEIVISKEYLSEIFQSIEKYNVKQGKEVLTLKLKGYSRTEIAKILNMDYRKVTKIFLRIRKLPVFNKQ